jgi:DNA ligase 1
MPYTRSGNCYTSTSGRKPITRSQTGSLKKKIPTKSKKILSKTKECVPKNSGSVVFTDKVLLAKEYIKSDGTEAVDPKGWWMSEKFDGYRAIWNGKFFQSRSKKRFDVPDWFLEIMPPSIPLDGEFWLGRSNFQKCGLFRRKKPKKIDDIYEWEQDWVKSKVMYKVFDIPNLEETPFEERMVKLEEVVSERKRCLSELDLPFGIDESSSPLTVTNHVKVKSKKHLKKTFEDVVSNGGEGVMIRMPGSLYENKRSATLLKYKEVADTEAIITGYKKGAGKYNGLLGAFECSMQSDASITFTVSGMDDSIRKSYKKTHPIGTIITIQYNGTTKSGKPRHPRYLRIRHKV